MKTLTTHTSYVLTCLGRLYDDFLLCSCTFIVRLGLCPENFTEESDQFRFRRDTYFTHLNGSVDLILSTASTMRVSIPLDLSPWSCIPLPHFNRSRHESTSPPSCPVLSYIPSTILSKWLMVTSWCQIQRHHDVFVSLKLEKLFFWRPSTLTDDTLLLFSFFYYYKIIKRKSQGKKCQV